MNQAIDWNLLIKGAIRDAVMQQLAKDAVAASNDSVIVFTMINRFLVEQYPSISEHIIHAATADLADHATSKKFIREFIVGNETESSFLSTVRDLRFFLLKESHLL